MFLEEQGPFHPFPRREPAAVTGRVAAKTGHFFPWSRHHSTRGFLPGENKGAEEGFGFLRARQRPEERGRSTRKRDQMASYRFWKGHRKDWKGRGRGRGKGKGKAQEER